MLRLSKQSDYATVLLAELAGGEQAVRSVSELAQQTQVSSPMVSKTLKLLARDGLVDSIRGASGGYRLNRPAGEISIADIIKAIEGPIAVTQCSHDDGCQLQAHCQIRPHWQLINDTIMSSLHQLSLAELCRPVQKIQMHYDSNL